jgi:hypothetical protein
MVGCRHKVGSSKKERLRPPNANSALNYMKITTTCSCQHPEMTTIQEDIATFLLKQLQDHGNSELINILQIAINGCRSNKTWQPSLEYTSQEWKRAITDQTNIGWIHIFYGRIATSMIQAMESHYQSLNINTKQYSGECWAKKFIINVWNSILKLWKQRNDIINDKENQNIVTALRDKLRSRVIRCYSFKDHLSSTERRLWFDKTIQEKLDEEPNNIQTWLSIVERIIRITKREQRKRPKASIIMERFLGLRHDHNTPSHQNTRSAHNPRAYIHELHPD